MEASSSYVNGQAAEKYLPETAEPQCSKRMRCEHQNSNSLDTKHSVDERIWKIFEREIDREIEERMDNLETIEKCIAQCHSDLHLLRKGVVKRYYENTYKTCTGKEQHRIHPAVSKLIGKRPRQSIDSVNNIGHVAESAFCDKRRTTRLSTVKEKETYKARNEKNPAAEKQKYVREINGKLPRYIPPKLPETCNSQDSLRTGNTQKYRMRVCVGNLAKTVNDSIYDKATHKWVLYVRSSVGSLNIEQEVSKIRFFLHPSYKPHDVVTVPSPPFVLHRRGWGEFPVRVRLCFANPLNKNVDIIHNLQLYGPNWGSFFKSTETVVDLWLHSDNVNNDDGEDQVGRLSEETEKHIKIDITLCNPNCQHTSSLDKKCMACKLDDANFENYKSENESGLGSDSETCSNELNKYLPEERVPYKGKTVQNEKCGDISCLKASCSLSDNTSSYHVYDNMGNTTVYPSDINENKHIKDIELQNDLDKIINFDLDYSDTDLQKSLLLDNTVEAESENIFITHISDDKNDLIVNTLLNGDFTAEFSLPPVVQNKECKNKEENDASSMSNGFHKYSYSDEDKWLECSQEKVEISLLDTEESECFQKEVNFKTDIVEKKVDVSSLNVDTEVGDNELTGIGLGTQNSFTSLDNIEPHNLKLEYVNIKMENEEIFCDNSVEENTDLLLSVSNSCNNMDSEGQIIGNVSSTSSKGVTFDGQSEIFDDVFNNWVEEIVIDSGNSEDYKVHDHCTNSNVSNNGILNECEGDILTNSYFKMQDTKQLEQSLNNENINVNITDHDNVVCSRSDNAVECFKASSEINDVEDLNMINNILLPLDKKVNSFVESVRKQENMNNGLTEQKHTSNANSNEDKSKSNIAMDVVSNNSTTVLQSDGYLNSVEHRIGDELLKGVTPKIECIEQGKGTLLVYSKNSLPSNKLTLNQSIFKGGAKIFIKNKRTKFKSVQLDSKHHQISVLADSSINATSIGSKQSPSGSKHVVFIPSKKVFDKNDCQCSDIDSSQNGSNSIILTNNETSDVTVLQRAHPENRTSTSILNREKLELKNNINNSSDVVLTPRILQRNTLHFNDSSNNKIPVSKLNNLIIVNRNNVHSSGISRNKVQPQIRPVVSVSSQNNRYILVPASDGTKMNKALVIQKSPVLQSSGGNPSTKHILVSTSAGNTKDGRLIVVKPPGVSLLKTKQQQHMAPDSNSTSLQHSAQNHHHTVSSVPEKAVFKDHKTLLLSKKLSKEIITETRIAQLYKCRDDLVNNCKFADIEAAVRWLVRGLPLVHTDVCYLPFKALHPYCAPDIETFLSWPRPKQHAAEWLRAKTVQRILKSKGCQDAWSTKQIMYWSRHHGYCPSYKLQGEFKGGDKNKDNIFLDKLSQYTHATEELGWAHSITEPVMDTTYIDVVGLSDSSQETVTLGSKEENLEHEDIGDNSEWGRNFHMLIKRSIEQMGCRIKQKVLEGRLVHSGAAQLIMSQSVHILAEDLLRRSLAAAHHREGTAVEVEDTHAALLSRPEFDLFTYRGLGVTD